MVRKKAVSSPDVAKLPCNVPGELQCNRLISSTIYFLPEKEETERQIIQAQSYYSLKSLVTKSLYCLLLKEDHILITVP